MSCWQGNVEQWLALVEERMREAVRAQTVAALAAYATTPRTKWVLQWPAMVVIAVSGIYWCKTVEESFSGAGGVAAARDQCTKELLDLTDVVRGKLSAEARMLLGALITIDVHARDVVADLTEAGVASTSDFEWVKQLRYYWRDDVYVDMVQVCCCGPILEHALCSSTQCACMRISIGKALRWLQLPEAVSH